MGPLPDGPFLESLTRKQTQESSASSSSSSSNDDYLLERDMEASHVTDSDWKDGGLINKGLRREVAYGEPEYWDKRYQLEEFKSYEWYIDYPLCKVNF